jgi:hypothetical protein
LQHPNIARILDDTYIIKIGHSDVPAFGKLYSFIRKDSKWLDELAVVLRDVNDDDVIVLSGFSLFIAIDSQGALNEAIRLIDLLPENVTIIGFYQDGLYDDRINRIIEKFYDVIIRIKREDGFMGFGETTFLVGVEQSAVGDVEPGFVRFRVGDGKLVEV